MLIGFVDDVPFREMLSRVHKSVAASPNQTCPYFAIAAPQMIANDANPHKATAIPESCRACTARHMHVKHLKLDVLLYILQRQC